MILSSLGRMRWVKRTNRCQLWQVEQESFQLRSQTTRNWVIYSYEQNMSHQFNAKCGYSCTLILCGLEYYRNARTQNTPHSVAPHSSLSDHGRIMYSPASISPQLNTWMLMMNLHMNLNYVCVSKVSLRIYLMLRSRVIPLNLKPESVSSFTISKYLSYLGQSTGDSRESTWSTTPASGNGSGTCISTQANVTPRKTRPDIQNKMVFPS